jgi:FkbM family methyltransferase
MWRYRCAGIVVERKVLSEVHGEGIGAWVVATGRLNADSVVYSVGVGTELSLDLSLVEKYGCKVHCFDPTPVSAEWVRGQELPPQIIFHEVGLAAYDGELAFRMPRKSGSAHFSPIQRDASDREDEMVKAPVWRLETMMQKLGHDHIDLLKIDIEGGEYEVIEDIVRLGDKVGQLLMEFHHCYRSVPLAKTVAAVERLRAAGFRIFSISPRTYEISFAR